MRARKARLPDADAIHGLIRSLSYDGTLLPRSPAEIYENIRDFTVVETDDGEFVGCGALHLYGPHLAEIRSIAVGEKAKGQGAGGYLVEALIEEAESHSVPCVCLFTRIPGFFQRFGFVAVDRTALPDKIYKDCSNCPRLNACDEFAMARGTLPDTAVLGPVRIKEHLVPLQV
ncbi:MAG TPA: N-acetyltransferase [Acidobacteriaceae bacterium]|nr:N-acetyltransferase [Acidobacteriaceae bacterium]